MQKAEDFYGAMNYGELFATWSAKYGREYTPNDLAAIHRRWKSLGKRVGHGAQVAIRDTPRRRRGR
jgi:hypothetical protein